MDPKEIEQEVDNLEPRLERLRSLYEQYFMGLEKIEPGTLRKDVDRKFWQLRKQRIQNTALRFRLQGLIQRYNSYQQYWARVMREMERGTYTRDVLRAAKRVGSVEALTILGRRRAEMFKQLASFQEARRDRAAQRAESLADEQSATLAEALAGGDAHSLVDPTEWDLLDDSPDPVPPGRADPEPEAPTGPWAARDVGPADDVPTTEWVVARGDEDDEDAIPTIPPPAPLTASVASGPGAARLPLAAAAVPNRAVSAAQAPAAPAPHRPQAGSPLRPAMPGVRLPTPAASPPATPPPKAPAKPTGGDAMRRLYEAYVRAKHAAHEPTEGLTLDKLERSLRKQTERLRQKHAGREIEYEVVTQNGRPLIRPVIK